MIGRFLEDLLRGASASSVTEWFVWIMLGIFVMSVVQGKKGGHGQFLEHAPSVLVSLGILGTFIGIVIGLLDFNAHDIKNSIEGLLDGLKTAFITSLTGMFLSLVLKAMDAWWFAPARSEGEMTPGTVTPELIYGAMSRQRDLLEALNQSLAGNEEGSVAGQLKLLRTDVNDFRQGLARDQQEFRQALFVQLAQFAEMLSRSATEVVIEALREVIQDFNRNLEEQFGDNFKALNESVVKMIQWQEQYKQHIEALEARIEIAVRELERTAVANDAISKSLATSEQSIGSIETHCQTIPTAIGQLTPVLQTNQHQIQELQRHLDAFVTLRDKAVRAVPEMQQHMDSLVKHLSEKMHEVAVKMHEGAQEFGRSVDHTNTALTEASHVISSHTEQIGTNMKDASQEFATSVRDTMEAMLRNAKVLEQQMREAVEQASRSMSDELKRVAEQIHSSFSVSVDAILTSLKNSVESTLSHTEAQIQGSANRTLGTVEAQVREATDRASASLDAQLTAMDQAIGRELEKVFREMGSALATISRRIADDHAALSQHVGVQ